MQHKLLKICREGSKVNWPTKSALKGMAFSKRSWELASVEVRVLKRRVPYLSDLRRAGPPVEVSCLQDYCILVNTKHYPIGTAFKVSPPANILYVVACASCEIFSKFPQLRCIQNTNGPMHAIVLHTEVVRGIWRIERKGQSQMQHCYAYIKLFIAEFNVRRESGSRVRLSVPMKVFHKISNSALLERRNSKSSDPSIINRFQSTEVSHYDASNLTLIHLKASLALSSGCKVILALSAILPMRSSMRVCRDRLEWSIRTIKFCKYPFYKHVLRKL
ncbi:hypothetical protein XU18_0006 [Perkinsela sp. CCAP 1560/4]|nr:hypothetical protein XU18_0006 [Perkinsela sp. CCAP 1560/4]|eukprot:KNH09321.1 hypothetical protein XU18_0006 [Perkinsela sp. CCAP 1560/4]